MKNAEKTKENRLRREAKKNGLRLHKSRVRYPNYFNRGGYMLVDTFRDIVVGGDRYNMTLDDVESYLNNDIEPFSTLGMIHFTNKTCFNNEEAEKRFKESVSENNFEILINHICESVLAEAIDGFCEIHGILHLMVNGELIKVTEKSSFEIFLN